ILLLLLEATRFRRPETWSAAYPLVLYGGIAVAFVTLAHQIVNSISTHSFAVGHDFTAHAVDQALTKGAANQVAAYLGLLSGLALAAGMIGVMVNDLRVGLIPRWMSILGMFTALLIVLPIGGAELQVIPAFWMVMMGILYVGRWPNAEPPAWMAGEARPWPAQARRSGLRGGTPAGGVPAQAAQALLMEPARRVGGACV